MVVKLPLAEPVVTSAPKHTDFLAILLTDEDGFNWLYCHYVNFFYEVLVEEGIHKKFGGGFLDMGVNPVNYCCLTRHSSIRFSEIQDDVIGFLKNQLNNGEYIISRLNQFYLPASKFFRTTNHLHTTMIFGYDDCKDIFYIYDFYNEKFKISTISNSELLNAFLDSRQDITTVLRNNRRYKFSLNRTLILLKDYYEGTDHTGYHFNKEYTIVGKPNYLFSTVEESNYDIVYGYEAMVKIVQDVCNVYPRKVLIHEICEHKLLMAKRLRFIQSNMNIDLSKYISKYEEIAKQTLILQSMYLKLRMCEKDLYQLIPEYRKIQEEEMQLLPNLINKIETYLL